MKFILATLLGFTAAVKLQESPDHPNSNIVFPYTEKSAPAAGFTQTSACVHANIPGIDCVPNSEFFAYGMAGDEDLGQEITMKNVKYKYHQNPENTKLFAYGMAGDEDLGQEITMKNVKYKYHQNPENTKLFAVGMAGDEDLGQEITMKGQKYKYHQKPAGN